MYAVHREWNEKTRPQRKSWDIFERMAALVDAITHLHTHTIFHLCKETRKTHKLRTIRAQQHFHAGRKERAYVATRSNGNGHVQEWLAAAAH